MEEKKEMSTEEIKMDNDPKGEGKEKATSPLREVLSWVVTLLAAFALAMVLKNYVIINATVPTGSMEHTIEPGDDKVRGMKFCALFRRIIYSIATFAPLVKHKKL